MDNITKQNTTSTKEEAKYPINSFTNFRSVMRSKTLNDLEKIYRDNPELFKRHGSHLIFNNSFKKYLEITKNSDLAKANEIINKFGRATITQTPPKEPKK